MNLSKEIFSCTKCNRQIYKSNLTAHDQLCTQSGKKNFYQISENFKNLALKESFKLKKRLSLLRALLKQRLESLNFTNEEISYKGLIRKAEKLEEMLSELENQNFFSLDKIFEIINNFIYADQKVSLETPNIKKIRKSFKNSKKVENLLRTSLKFKKYFSLVKTNLNKIRDVQYKVVYENNMIIKIGKRVYIFNLETFESIFLLKTDTIFDFEVLGKLEFLMFYEENYLIIWNIKLYAIEKKVFIGKILSFNVLMSLNESHAVIFKGKNKKNNELEFLALNLKSFESENFIMKVDFFFIIFMVSDDMKEFYFADRMIIRLKEHENELIYKSEEKIRSICLTNNQLKILVIYSSHLKIIELSSRNIETTVEFDTKSIYELSFLTSDRNFLILSNCFFIDLETCSIFRDPESFKQKSMILRLTSKSVGISKMNLYILTDQRNQNIINFLDFHNPSNFKLKTKNCEKAAKMFFVCIQEKKIFTLNFNDFSSRVFYENSNLYDIKLIENNNQAYCIENKETLFFWRLTSNYPESSFEKPKDLLFEKEFKLASTQNFIILTAKSIVSYTISFKRTKSSNFSTFNYQTIIYSDENNIIYQKGSKIFKLGLDNSSPILILKNKNISKCKKVIYITRKIIGLAFKSELLLLDLEYSKELGKIEYHFTDVSFIDYHILNDCLLLSVKDSFYLYDLKFSSPINISSKYRPFVVLKENFIYIHYKRNEYATKYITICDLIVVTRGDIKFENVENAESYEKIGFCDKCFYTISKNCINIYSSTNITEKITIETNTLEVIFVIFNDTVIIAKCDSVSVQSISFDDSISLNQPQFISSSLNNESLKSLRFLFLPDKKFLIVFGENIPGLIRVVIYDLENFTVFREYPAERIIKKFKIEKINECFYVYEGKNHFHLFINDEFKRMEYSPISCNFYEYFIENQTKVEENLFNEVSEYMEFDSSNQLFETMDNIVIKNRATIVIFCREHFSKLIQLNLNEFDIKVYVTGKLLIYSTKSHLNVFDLSSFNSRKISIFNRIKEILFISRDEKKAFIKTLMHNLIQVIDLI